MDEATAAVKVYLLKYKSEVIKKLKKFIQQMRAPKILRSDNAKEFKSAAWKEVCRQHKIFLQYTISYSSLQNAISERRIGLIQELTRSLLLQRDVPSIFWPYAVKTASYLMNRRPDTVRQLSPYELLNGEAPPVDHFKVFGCLCYYNVSSDRRQGGKLSAPGFRAIFLGYPLHKKGYKVFSIDENKVISVRSVRFVEDKNGSSFLPSNFGDEDYFEPYDTESSDDESSDEEYAVVEGENVEERDDSQEGTSDADNVDSERSPERDSETIQLRQHSEDPQDDSQDQETASSSDPDKITVRRSTRVHRPPGTWWQVSSTSKDYSAQQIDVPKSYLEAVKDESWVEAIKNELSSLIGNQTWVEVETVPENKKPISTKWVFTLKRDDQGNIDKYKARLVARGFTQVFNRDYLETFSPVTKLTTVRILTAVATLRGFNLKKADTKTAYLHADMKEDLYIEVPQGYLISNPNAKALKLQKAIYGLKQSGKNWYDTLTQFLKDTLKLQQSKVDPCLFLKSTNKFFAIAAYVDDIFGCVEDEQDWIDFMSAYRQRFKVSVDDNANSFLGVQFYRTNDSTGYTEIAVHQAHYIEQLLERFNMKDCDPRSTPAVLGDANALLLTEKVSSVANVPFRELVGALLFLSRNTRPDISFAVNFISRFNDCFQEKHWRAAKRILRYLKGTKQLCLTYNSQEQDFFGYCDSDWAQDRNDRKSTTGYVFFFAGAPISWATKKQQSVAMSTCEAEYMAMSEATKEVMYLRQLLQSINVLIKI